MALSQPPRRVDTLEAQEEVRLCDLPAWAASWQRGRPLATIFEIDCDRFKSVRQGLTAVLDASERADLSRNVDLLQSDRSAMVRGALRWVLGAYTGLSPGAVPLVRSPDGRPRVNGAGSSPAIHLSSSSCGAFGAFVIASGAEVGIDVEVVDARRFPVTIARDILHPRELNNFDSLPPDERCAWLARAWVCKEAVLKGLGLGLGIDPRQVEVVAADRSSLSREFSFQSLSYAPWSGCVRARGKVLTAIAYANPSTATRTIRLTG